MGEILDYLSTFALFPFGLRRFFQRRIDLEDARRIVHDRMEHREENFLRLVEKSIYGSPASPYRSLLRMAGCEMSDLRARVKQKGLENTLSELRAEGVYVTYEELKGRKPIVRNGLTLQVTARDFDNPHVRHDFGLGATSGSTGAATYVGIAFETLAAYAVNGLILSSAHGVGRAPRAIWIPGLPGPGVTAALWNAYAGRPIDRWFLPIGWRDSKYWFKYGLATWYMIVCSRALGVKVPWPQVLRLDQASVIAHWMADMLREHKSCVHFSGVSQALRVCVAAAEEKLDLQGAVFEVGGEPITPAKAQAIQGVGARLLNYYTLMEAAGFVGLGCARSDDPGDVHVTKDAFAVIPYPYAVENLGITVQSLNLTSLLDTSSKILLNVQIDDCGIVEERSCGCELESYGFTTHLRDIRSYSKLVGEGVTLMGNEMLRILEQTLPARFGGSALDYQLTEQEDAQGLTRLCLTISPKVRIADESEVISVMLNALRESSPMADGARTLWQQAQTIQIKRQEPVWTGYKLQPLRIQSK